MKPWKSLKLKDIRAFFADMPAPTEVGIAFDADRCPLSLYLMTDMPEGIRFLGISQRSYSIVVGGRYIDIPIPSESVAWVISKVDMGRWAGRRQVTAGEMVVILDEAIQTFGEEA